MSAPPTETAGSVSDVEMRLAAALEHHQAGRREQAEQIYAEVLAGEPDEPTALYLSGLLAFETGRPVEAVTRLQRVTQLKPQQPQGWA
ncbi:MAG: tetratricopeptide repeat protein, partial [Caulobacteraceae bacterium]